jgi:hypothetical protein
MLTGSFHRLGFTFFQSTMGQHPKKLAAGAHTLAPGFDSIAQRKFFQRYLLVTPGFPKDLFPWNPAEKWVWSTSPAAWRAPEPTPPENRWFDNASPSTIG